ncbi:hypothetical protein ACPZ19_03185 [Amycolatopsis lurida]
MVAPDQPRYTPAASGGFFDQLGANAEGLAKLAYATGEALAAPPGGYSFSPDLLVSIAKKWDDLANLFEGGLEDAQTIASTQGPGAEYASGGNAERIRGTGEALMATLVARRDYCWAQAEKFRAAAGSYGEAEARAKEDIEQQDGTL